MAAPNRIPVIVSLLHHDLGSGDGNALKRAARRWLFATASASQEHTSGWGTLIWRGSKVQRLPRFVRPNSRSGCPTAVSSRLTPRRASNPGSGDHCAGGLARGVREPSPATVVQKGGHESHVTREFIASNAHSREEERVLPCGVAAGDRVGRWHGPCFARRLSHSEAVYRLRRNSERGAGRSRFP